MTAGRRINHPLTPDDPRHGEYAGAVAHIRAGDVLTEDGPCLPCLEARRRYFRRISKMRELGRSNVAPLGQECIERILSARDVGITWEGMADQVGLAASTLFRLVNPPDPTKRVPHRTRALILRWHPRGAVTGIGVTRRVQALMWLGYSGQEIANGCGISAETVFEGARYDRTAWQMRVREALLAFYADHWDKPRKDDETLSAPVRAAAMRVHRRAVEKGWAPPLAWDDIDDPNETPEGVRVDIGQRTKAAQQIRLDVLELLDETGGTLQNAMDRLGMNRDALWAWCDFHGVLPLYNRLAERDGLHLRNANWSEAS